MSGRMVKEACKAAAGSMAELVEEKARYGGKEEQDGEKDDKKGEDYYEKTVQFECSICGLCEMCQYLGRKPPFTKHLLEFDEDVFVMIDPFKVYQSNVSIKRLNEKKQKLVSAKTIAMVQRLSGSWRHLCCVQRRMLSRLQHLLLQTLLHQVCRV